MIEHVLRYAEIGWRVFPCGVKDKKPLVADWPTVATVDTNQLQAWWAQWPKANIGVATGVLSKLFTLDVDGTEGSISLDALELEIGPLPETLEGRTGSGGRHLHFIYPDREVRNKQGFRPGLDIRGEGGYVIVPPSIHPVTGHAYEWPYGDADPIVAAPEAFLDVICKPDKKPESPWGNRAKISPPPALSTPNPTPIVERASLYLRECEDAVEGSAGHNSLLWAARALVIGFELSDSDALSLLWSDFNPRCNPPWDYNNPAARKDFERKVTEARSTPAEKPAGWLLDEFGLRSNKDLMARMGRESAGNLLAAGQGAPEVEPANLIVKAPLDIQPLSQPVLPDYAPFPVEHFPPEIEEYCRQVSESQGVDPSFVCLPVLAVAAAAMGNAWRLRLKHDFEVPPIIWVALVSPSGTNKSGPLRAITAPLRRIPELDSDENSLFNPQGRMVVSDTTLEAVIARLAGAPRGLLMFRDELAAWAKSFNAYKKGGGGDEQAWIECWSGHEYQLDRKTDREETYIPAASISVLGGIQPAMLAECFDPGRFASGLVPRLIIASPPDKGMFWSEYEVSTELQDKWEKAIIWLRTRPFNGLDPLTQRYLPHVLNLEPTAKSRYVDYFDEISAGIVSMSEVQRMFASKSRLFAARFCLKHRGLWLATEGGEISDPVPRASMEAGIAWAKWGLNEQLRVYGLAAQQYQRSTAQDLMAIIKVKLNGVASPRQLMRINGRRYNNKGQAKDALQQLVAAGLGTWDAREKVMTLK